MSLRDGSAKMSKSDPSDQSRINLLDDADAIAAKIKRAKTDPEPLPGSLEELKARPEADNLIGIYAALAGEAKADVLARFEGQGFGAFKPALVMRRLMADPAEIDRVLADGAERAGVIAEKTVAEVRKIVGLWPGR
jgi:tryptophanyl-tRNA synthetase